MPSTRTPKSPAEDAGPGYGQVLRQALAHPIYPLLAASAALAYLALYLYAIGQVVLDSRVANTQGGPAVLLIPNWPSRLLEPIAGHTFEPVLTLYAPPVLALFLAPANLLIGSVLGSLVGLNVATAAFALACVRSCRRVSWAGLLGSLPGLLTGFACCVPTVARSFGLQRTVTNDHAALGHYGFIAAFSFTVIGVGLLASLRPDGWRLTASVAGFLPALLGLASVVFSDADSSLGLVWALAAIAWGVVFVAAVELTQDAEGPTLLGSRGVVSKSERG